MGSILRDYFYGYIRQYQNPGHLMEVEQSVLAVELEPTDHVCVLYLLWTSLVFCMPSGP